jgi:radical SAM superfamily enzyme YgiQ (UPF0313 family)
MSKKEPKVLLVYPPNQLMDIEVPRPDGSLGPLYLAGALRDAGIHVELLDASVGAQGDSLQETFFHKVRQKNGLTRIGMTFERICDYIAEEGFDIVGISSMFTPQTRMVLEFARAVKFVNKKTLVVLGGVNATALSVRFLASGFVDVIASSESESFIVRLVRAWQKDEPLESLDAVILLKKGKVFSRHPSLVSIYNDLDKLPFPAWDMLPFDKYENTNSPHGSITPGKRRRYAPIMTSRGCPFRCSYCHISEEKSNASNRGQIGALRLKSIERVMREVEILRSLGVTHLYFEDDSLLAKKERVTEIFRRVAGLDMKISNVNGVNLIHFGIASGGKLVPDQGYLEVMKKSGFDEIVFPVESGNQRILDKYASSKLNLERFDVLELVKVASKVGITCPINMMIGFPDETEEEIMQSVELARKLIGAGATYVTFFIPIPFPGSRLFSQAVAGGHLSADFDPDEMNWKNAIMRNTVVPPERVMEIRDWAWESVNTKEYVKARRLREIGNFSTREV